MNLSTIAGLVLISTTVCNSEELPGEPFDYNFDGHMDYRVLTVSNAKSSCKLPRQRDRSKGEVLVGLLLSEAARGQVAESRMRAFFVVTDHPFPSQFTHFAQRAEEVRV